MKNILISRTDNLGDVALTLPVAGVLRELYPDSNIAFLGKRYTRPLIEACEHIDSFVDWGEIRHLPPSERLDAFTSIHADTIIHVFPDREIARLAAKARVPVRLGTSRRIYHWLYCNRKVNFTRRGSDLHEAQLNLKLIVPLGAKSIYPLSEIPAYYGLTKVKELKSELEVLLSAEKTNLILHPKTKGSAREWGIDNFSNLVEILPEQDYRLFITGTAEDGIAMRAFLKIHENRVFDMTGKLDLGELIGFINAADGLVAASTGPLHFASALNKVALGLYAPMRPIHAGRWAPVGRHASFLSIDKKCSDCRKSLECECIRRITPEAVYRKLEESFGK